MLIERLLELGEKGVTLRRDSKLFEVVRPVGADHALSAALQEVAPMLEAEIKRALSRR